MPMPAKLIPNQLPNLILENDIQGLHPVDWKGANFDMGKIRD